MNFCKGNDIIILSDPLRFDCFFSSCKLWSGRSCYFLFSA
nr:MAG TPA: hypothetical protein [Caudoviricetes sp.]